MYTELALSFGCRLLGRRTTGTHPAVILALAAASCGFPDHSFLDDSEFYGTGTHSGGSQGSGNSDAGAVTGSGNATGGGGKLGGGGNGQNGGGGNIGGSSGDASVVTAGGFPGNGGFVTIIDSGRIPPPEAGQGGAGGAVGGTGGAPVDSGPTCNPGLDPCSGTCVDFQTDNNHCGNCTTKCTAPNLCTGGQCQSPCDPGLTVCGGNCVDILTDESNCGRCGGICPGGTVCENKQCLIDCGALTRCPGNLCVDTTSDSIHCGNCTTVCTSGQLCSNSVCRTTCQSPFVNCNNECVNPNTDDQHCGPCPGVACATGKHCVGGTCQTLVENCQNGTDDDEDGAIDCADTDCGSFVCAGTPLGWTGPIALWSGTAGTAPSCAGSYPSDLLDAHDNLTVPPSTCPNCTCTPQGASCPSLSFYYDTTTDCSSSSAWTVTVTSTGTCQPTPTLVGGSTARSSQLIPPATKYVSGSCVGSQPTPTFSTPSWNTDVLGCGSAATSGGGCGAGQCLPKPSSPFKTTLCVFRAGINSCPSSYPVPMPSAAKPQYYATYTDGRSCTACSCGAPTCGGTVTTYTDTACSQNGTVVDITTACTTIAADDSRSGGDSRSLRWTNGGAVCGSASSSLQGSVTPDTPVTVCCQN